MEKKSGFSARGGWRGRGLIVACILVCAIAQSTKVYGSDHIDAWMTANGGFGTFANDSLNQDLKDAIYYYIDRSGDLDSIKAAIEASNSAGKLPLAAVDVSSNPVLKAQQETPGNYHVVLGTDWGSAMVAQGDTGGIFIRGNGLFTIENAIANRSAGDSSSPSSFYATASGGVFYLFPTGTQPLLILTSDGNAKYYITNQQGRRGGAIANFNGFTYIEHAIFDANYNSGPHYGGAILNYSGYMVLENVEFINNIGNTGGGAIYNHQGSISINNALFDNNITTDVSDPRVAIGGALVLDGTNQTIANTTFSNNIAKEKGGAIYLGNAGYLINTTPNSGKLTLIADDGKNIIFSGNIGDNDDTISPSTADGPNVHDGGAIYAYAGSTITLSGDGDFWFGDAGSTDTAGGTAKDNVDSIYMDTGATFTKTGTGIIQLVGSHKIDTGSGGNFEIEDGTVRIANNGVLGSSGTEVVDTVDVFKFGSSSSTSAMLAGYGVIKATTFTLENTTFSPDGDILTPTVKDIATGKEIGTIALDGNVTLNGPTTFVADINSPTDHDKVDISGNLTVNQTITVDPTLNSSIENYNDFISAFPTGVPLMTAASIFSSLPFKQIVTNVQPGDFAANSKKLVALLNDPTNPNKLVLTIAPSRDLIWTDSNTNDTWDVMTTTNWVENGIAGAVDFENGDNVTFNGQGTGDVVIAAGAEPGIVTVSAGDYTYSGAELKAAGGVNITGGSATFATDIKGNVSVASGATFGVIDSHTLTGDLTASGATLEFTGSSVSPNFTFLKVLGTATISATTKISVILQNSSPALKEGDKLNLISATSFTTGKLVPNPATTKATGTWGGALKYLFDIENDGATLSIVVPKEGSGDGAPKGIQTTPEAKAYSEGYLTGLAMLNQSGDLLLSAFPKNFAYDFEGFAITSGGTNRYNTGSHVDLKSFNLIAGATKGFALKNSKLTLGAFFEYGTGTYDTYNSFNPVTATIPHVHGDGDLKYFGGGALGRIDLAESASGHLYFEGSARAGRIKNKYDSNDIVSAGVVATYDAKAHYYGFHAGIGYDWKISEKTSLDLSAKYFFTKEKGDDVKLSTGAVVNFEDVNSSRIRLGGRLTSKKSDKVAPYAALSYEYEADGKAKASVLGYAIDAPSLKGSTGIGELGVTLTPTGKLTVDLGVQGYAGKRQGITASLRVKYAF